MNEENLIILMRQIDDLIAMQKSQVEIINKILDRIEVLEKKVKELGN